MTKTEEAAVEAMMAANPWNEVKVSTLTRRPSQLSVQLPPVKLPNHPSAS